MLTIHIHLNYFEKFASPIPNNDTSTFEKREQSLAWEIDYIDMYMQKCSVPIWMVLSVAYGQSNFWRFSMMKEKKKNADIYAKYVFFSMSKRICILYSNSDMPKHVTATTTTTTASISTRENWIESGLYSILNGFRNEWPILSVQYTLSLTMSHIKYPCSYTLEQERHFTFAKSFIWKFFRLCFRHVSSSCQCQCSYIAMRMIWMCCFYISRPYFIYVQPLAWPFAIYKYVYIDDVCIKCAQVSK